MRVSRGGIKFDARGTPIVQPGQTFEYDPSDSRGASLGGALIGRESNLRAQQTAAAQRVRWDAMQVDGWSGRTSQVTAGYSSGNIAGAQSAGSVDPFSLVTNNYHVPTGPVSRYYDGQVGLFSDSNQSWLVRSVSFVNATLAAPLMLMEEGGRGIMNVPHAGSQIGQNAAIYSQATDTDTKVIAGLKMLKFTSEGMVNAYAGAVLGRQVYVQAQDEAVSFWLKRQFDGDARKFNEVYSSTVDGTRRLGYSFDGVTGYRAHNNDVMATKGGNYMSLERPTSPADAIERSALNPSWGNNATELFEVTTRPGVYFKGQVAPQSGWYNGSRFELGGGNTQIYMPSTPNPTGGRPIAPWTPSDSRKLPYEN